MLYVRSERSAGVSCNKLKNGRCFPIFDKLLRTDMIEPTTLRGGLR